MLLRLRRGMSCSLERGVLWYSNSRSNAAIVPRGMSDDNASDKM